ncbi:HNH endonuclease [Kaistia soli DSM 19436]|uniref:HNH endonuclease n=1 Tax=Kaistia soli DSM 19436 TaxID=1122133 RepID=A0A1M5PQ67_9HYPH|nr:HNH endonuclease [Kaistia soli]SHH03888.1 HNH endonuclease [Kaistia soli DSM 19436]
MPFKPPRIRPCCGEIVPAGELCACQRRRLLERHRRHDARRPSAWRRGYDREHRIARMHHLAQHPNCVMCSEPATIADHVVAHRGDRALLRDASNLQSLCATCHSSIKQRLECQP